MIRVFSLLAISSAVLSCSVGPGWIAPTVEEQVNYAGAVFKGVVSKVTGNQFTGFIVTVTKTNYFKGCGPATVRISGYRGSSLCTPDPPKIGDSIFAFVCKGTTYDWDLNNFEVGTGSLIASANIEAQVTNLTADELSCSNCCFMFKRCKKRPVKPIVVPMSVPVISS